MCNGAVSKDHFIRCGLVNVHTGRLDRRNIHGFVAEFKCRLRVVKVIIHRGIDSGYWRMRGLSDDVNEGALGLSSREASNCSPTSTVSAMREREADT